MVDYSREKKKKKRPNAAQPQDQTEPQRKVQHRKQKAPGEAAGEKRKKGSAIAYRWPNQGEKDLSCHRSSDLLPCPTGRKRGSIFFEGSQSHGRGAAWAEQPARGFRLLHLTPQRKKKKTRRHEREKKKRSQSIASAEVHCLGQRTDSCCPPKEGLPVTSRRGKKRKTQRSIAVKSSRCRLHPTS